MKYFEEPKIEVEEFEITDVITASNTDCTLQGGETCVLD